MPVKKFLIVLTLVMACRGKEGSGDGHKGPLFIQVHFTSRINSITYGQLNGILSGKTLNFSKIGAESGRINLYSDKNISEITVKEYPAIKTRSVSFNEACVSGRRDVIGDRHFMGISDSRGLTPCLKTVYIDNKLPWGKLEKDRTLKEEDDYGFNADGAEAWDTGRHFTLVQTGVTAMTRAFIRAVEKTGNIDYTVEETRGITSGADISVTSNEVSFTGLCGYPLRDRMLFCSPVEYFDILRISGFDVIELTGNHNNDYGSEYNTATINLIAESGMRYYGGGRNIKDAEKILYLKVKSLRLAFVGFNQWGPANAWATDTKPGAARLTENKFAENIRKAVAGSHITIVSVQWGNENNPVPHRSQVEFFHRAAELGADIMISSSAHRAMGLEFFRGKFISYGLGNFLFDQMQTLNHRRGLIARHHIYRGKHIETELIPYMIYNYSQPRLLNKRVSLPLWNNIFRYSLGPVFR